jgi:hypothetical protein
MLTDAFDQDEDEKYVRRILGRYTSTIDIRDVMNTAYVEFLEDGGGSKEIRSSFLSLVAARFKQTARRSFKRTAYLDSPVGRKSEGRPTVLGELLPATCGTPDDRLPSSEAFRDAMIVAESICAEKPDGRAKLEQMERILKTLFIEDAESFAAAFKCERNKGLRMKRSVAFELWWKILSALKPRYTHYLPKRNNGKRDGRRKH